MPIRYVGQLIRSYLFWLAVFATNRLVFLFYNFDFYSKYSSDELLTAFKKAVYLDTSMASYFLTVPLLTGIVQCFLKKDYTSKFTFWFTGILLTINSAIVAGELPLFREWNGKLSYKIFLYLQQPAEVMKITPWGIAITVTLILLGQIVLGLWVYKKLVYSPVKPESQRPKPLLSAVAFLLMTTVTVLGIRGGTQEMPIQQSDVYFSNHTNVNLLAVNSTWNIIHSILKNKKYMNKNPYGFYKPEEAKEIVKEVYSVKGDSAVSFLKTDRPNVVLLILESFTSDLIEEQGGIKGITPRFDQMIDEGLFFDHLYASAERSEQGMASIFSGFPAQQRTSISAQPSKAQQLPSILNPLHEQGYSSSFHFGGQLNFGNIKAFLLSIGMQNIVDEEDFTNAEKTSRLGAHDEYLFRRVLADQKNYKQPFISTIFTQSTHSPYDQPVQDAIEWEDDPRENMKGFLNGAWYTDSCVYDYVNKAKAMDWYENTIFVMLADHSHTSPRYWERDVPQSRLIPMLFWGPALKDEFKGKRVNKVACQTDVPATLLGQMNLDSSPFEWSKNLMDPKTEGFAYYCSNNGLGWIDSLDRHMVYRTDMDSVTMTGFGTDKQAEKKSLRKAKAYLQTVFQQYLDY
ncbi:sulfatase [Fulvitalea axinellae]|uniref:Sulfatase n=1 Tax=Fulvitalea axinellae TaxID=1182444 RepID=A0AAU9CMN4_9BACT|nr:sulfatase [Fulvitalea axinellae]